MNGEGEAAGYAIPPRWWAWLGTRRAISVLLWIVAFSIAGYLLWQSRTWFDDPRTAPEVRKRADGNSGHAQIDFGGQWVMARMLVLGYGRELYHRQRQWDVVRAGFPIEDEMPLIQLESPLPTGLRKIAKPDEELAHDADNLMSWFMGSDPDDWRTVGGAAAAPQAAAAPGNPLLTFSLQQAATDAVTPAVVEKVTEPAIGGPLYPPVHAFFYAPIGMIDHPQRAYHVFQIISIAMVFVAALGVNVLSRGRIWWSVATILLLLFPGTRGGLDLGQNPTLTLSIVIWGWALASRGYPVAGGMVWGLFAFKPVWALAFLLVPLLTRRWRFGAAMLLTGAALVAATLPLVGVQSWLDWLAVGRKAAALYNVNFNWIHLSRDLQSIPRRILHNFNLPEPERDTALAQILAWSLWGMVLATTAAVYLRYADRKRFMGVGAAFLFFGAFLTCYRFMYYDALLAAAGCAILFAEPARFLRTRMFGLGFVSLTPPISGERGLDIPPTAPSFLGSRLVGYINSFPLTILALMLLYETSLSGLDFKATLGFGRFDRVTTGASGTTGMMNAQLQFDTGIHYPWETVLVFLLWAWCGWRLIRGEERE